MKCKICKQPLKYIPHFHFAPRVRLVKGRKHIDQQIVDETTLGTKYGRHWYAPAVRVYIVTDKTK